VIIVIDGDKEKCQRGWFARAFEYWILPMQRTGTFAIFRNGWSIYFCRTQEIT
jgi:hypothetical protein